MKAFRYRKPSIKTLSGYSKMKRKTKRSLGISQVQGWTQPSRLKQKAKYRTGLYSPAARIIRNTAKGRYPTFLGLFRKK